MKSNDYDQYLKGSLLKTSESEKYLKPGTVYYNGKYLKKLLSSLVDNKCLNKYLNELSENSQGVKMCSIGSSSRLCYLASFSERFHFNEYEKTDIKNDCCRPHYDGYDENSHTFYEFKCHELCDGYSHYKLSDSYKGLLKSYYGIEDAKPSDLKFSHFGISNNKFKDKSIYKINFDFKQFLCHVFGILASTSRENKASLKYVWVVPSLSYSEVSNFVANIKEEINELFECFKKTEINFDDQRLAIEDLIDIRPIEIVEITEIKDFLLESLDEM